MTTRTMTTTRPETAVTDNLLNQLPGWLRYLVGAYPAARVNAATFAVYEDQAADADPDELLAAVRVLVRAQTWRTFPAVGELWQAVEAYRREQALAPRQVGDLTARRHDLMQRAYAGEINGEEWGQLMADFAQGGRRIGAAHLKRTLTRLTEVAE